VSDSSSLTFLRSTSLLRGVDLFKDKNVERPSLNLLKRLT
jgi:hypothetical protein